MFRQKSTEDTAVAPDMKGENEAKSITNSKRPFLRETSGTSETNKSEQTMKEKLSSLGNVNLASLTKHLFAKEDLKEDDVHWPWDSLFTEVASELRAEWEKSASNN